MERPLQHHGTLPPEWTLFAADGMDVQRDLYRLVQYVARKPFSLTARDLDVPKGARDDLAKVLEGTHGHRASREGYHGWPVFLLNTARRLGFCTPPMPAPDPANPYRTIDPESPQVAVLTAPWAQYLASPQLNKAERLQDTLVHSQRNEFFFGSFYVPGERFDYRGSAVGPASRMDLPRIRKTLLKWLGNLEPNVWYLFDSLVERLQADHPHLIMDPSTREPDRQSKSALSSWEWDCRVAQRKKSPKPPKPEMRLEDLYGNFVEHKRADRWHQSGNQLTEQTPNVFRRVEGRYLEYFLSQIPYLLGYVDLALRQLPGNERGEVLPELGSLAAVRLTTRGKQILTQDARLNEIKATTLPNFEIVIESSLFPDKFLSEIEVFCTVVDLSGPMYRLKLDKKKTLATVAANPDQAAPLAVLRRWSSNDVPGNVAVELETWGQKAESFVVYQGFELLELVKPETDGNNVQGCLNGVNSRQVDSGFYLVSAQDLVLRLERIRLPPKCVEHVDLGPEVDPFVGIPGRLESKRPRSVPGGTDKSAPRKTQSTPVAVTMSDLVGVGCANKEFLVALHAELSARLQVCFLADDGLLVVAGKDLPLVRKAFKTLANRFVVTE